MSTNTRTQILAALDAMPQIHTWPTLLAARELVRRTDDPVEALLHAIGIMAREHDDMERIATQALERAPFILPVNHEADARVDRYVASLPRSPSRPIT